MKNKLHKFINHDYTFIAIFVLIITSVVVTGVDIVSKDAGEQHICSTISQVLTAIFIVELFIRLYVAESFKLFFKDCWLEIIAVIPVARSLRLLRLLRVLRLLGWGLRARRLHKLQSLGTAFSENVAIIMIMLVVVSGATMGILIIEKDQNAFQSFSSAIWWAIATLMAGEPIYGEPTTIGGKLITMILMISGFTLFAVFTGVVSAYMVKRLRDDVEVGDHLLSSLKDHFIICGWNRSATNVISELQAAESTCKSDIVVITEERPQFEYKTSIKGGGIFFIQDDYTTGAVLKRAKVETARGAIFLAGKEKERSDLDRDARTILTALTTEKMLNESGRGIYSCVELLNRDREKVNVLKDADVEDVIEGNEFMGHLIAHSVLVDGLIHIMRELLTSTWGSEFSVIDNDCDQTFGEAIRHYKNDKDMIIVGYGKHQTETTINFKMNPQTDLLLEKGTPLMAITPHGKNENEKFQLSTLHEPQDLYDGSYVNETIDNVSGHIIVCGLNRATPRIIKELSTNNKTKNRSIVFISEIEELPAELRKYRDRGQLLFISGDCTSNQILNTARVEHAHYAVITAEKSNTERSDQDRDARTILAALTIEKRNPAIKTCVELLHKEEHKENILRMANVETIICGDEYLGCLIAHSTRSPGLAQALAELLRSNHGNEFKRVAASTTQEIINKPFSEVLYHYWEKHRSIIVGIQTRESENTVEYLTNPHKDHLIKETDLLYIIEA